MRRLAQFVRLRASRVSRLASVCVSRLRLSRVCVHLSRVRLASACICLACVSRLSASVHVKGSECVHLSCVCLRASVCVCLASVVLSRVCRLVSRLSSCLASVSRRSSCLASVCLLVNACGNWLILCVGRHSKSSKRFLLSSYYLIMSQCQSIHPIT